MGRIRVPILCKQFLSKQKIKVKSSYSQAMSELDSVSIHDGKDVGVGFSKYKSK